MVSGRGGMPMMPPMEMDPRGTARLVEFLRNNRHGERFLMASPASIEAGPVIVATGEPAIALGGFMGLDPVVTEDEFAAMVKTGQLRFVMIGPGPGGMPFPPGGMRGGPGGMPFPPGGMPGMPGGPGNSKVMAWVREHGKVVDPKFWRAEEADERPPQAPAVDDKEDPFRGFMAMFGRMQRMAQLYDCRPEFGLIATTAR
jgi:hypothetical protein